MNEAIAWKLVAIGGVALTLQGCANPKTSFADTNARGVFMVNENGTGGSAGFKNTVALQGVMDATLVKSGSEATLTTPDGTIHNLDKVPGSNNFYSDPGRVIFATDIPDVDRDGTADDTFLVFTINNPESRSRTEYSMAYAGTRSPSQVVTNLQSNSHKATYTGQGTGSFMGAIGNQDINYKGDLTMDVDFAGDGNINGKIDNLQNLTGNVQANPVTALTFGGNLNVATAGDFNITGVALENQGTLITPGLGVSNTPNGVGSFFGPNAGGVIGVFGGSGIIRGTEGPSPTRVNLLGSFHGSTTDNNP